MTQTAIIAQFEHVLRIHPDNSATLTYRFYSANKPAQQRTVEYPPGTWLDLARTLVVQGHADAKEARLKQEGPPIEPGVHVVTGAEGNIMKAGLRIVEPHGCPVCAAHTRLVMLFSADEWEQMIKDAQKAAEFVRDANDVTRN